MVIYSPRLTSTSSSPNEDIPLGQSHSEQRTRPKGEKPPRASIFGRSKVEWSFASLPCNNLISQLQHLGLFFSFIVYRPHEY